MCLFSTSSYRCPAFAAIWNIRSIVTHYNGRYIFGRLHKISKQKRDCVALDTVAIVFY